MRSEKIELAESSKLLTVYSTAEGLLVVSSISSAAVKIPKHCLGIESVNSNLGIKRSSRAAE